MARVKGEASLGLGVGGRVLGVVLIFYTQYFKASPNEDLRKTQACHSSQTRLCSVSIDF